MTPRELAEQAFRQGVGVRDLHPPAPAAPAAVAPTPAPAPTPPAPSSPVPLRRPVFGPKDFPSVPNAARLQLAGPETQAEHTRRVTSPEAVRNGTWARERGQILSQLGGPPQISSSGTVYAAGLQPAPASQQAQPPGPQGSIQQPHGHAMTGPVPPLLAAKHQQMRERRRALKGR
jgi:hypothetical protein